MYFFAPGRTEIIGNHTDHQLGRVIAAPVKQGISGDCLKRDDGVINISASDFGDIKINLSELDPKEQEKGSSAALLRGMAQAFWERGLNIGGFDAEIKSKLKPGGGLSSSAAFSVLIGRILSGLYNGGTVDSFTIAKCARQAENRHFGKPSGLMDQLACSLDSAVYIDFLTGEIQPVSCDFEKMGLALCLTYTGGSHQGLTEAYAEIPEDMSSVAKILGKELLGYVNPDDFYDLPYSCTLRYLRAEHFFSENRRVLLMRNAIQDGDAQACMRLMNESGRSSEEKLQNIYCENGDHRLEKGLEISAKLLSGTGAWRVHGGGFAGCVQALMPKEEFNRYKVEMNKEFGENSCTRIM